MSWARRWLTALVAAGMLAGCGSGSEESFRTEQLRPLEQRVERERADLAAVLRSARSGNAKDARALRRGVERMRSTTSRIAALEAPEPAREQLRRFVGALERLSDEVTGLAAHIERDDVNAQRAQARRISGAADAVAGAQGELTAALDAR